MIQQIRNLREKRYNLVQDSRKILEAAEAENRDLTTEESQQFDRINEEVDKLGEQVNRLETQLDRERELAESQEEIENRRLIGDDGGEVVPRDQQVNLALRGWFASQYHEEPTDDERAAAQALGVRLAYGSQIELALDTNYNQVRRRVGSMAAQMRAEQMGSVQNALQTTTAAGGGVLVPEGFMDSFETAMLAFGPMLQIAHVIRTTNANPLPWPTGNDTGNSGRQIGEGVAVSTQDPSLAAKTLLAYKFTSDEVLVSFELLRDNAVNLAMVLGEMLGERLGRIQNTKFTTGTGAATAEGILTGATLGVTAGSATEITTDEVIDLEAAVDPAYRGDPSFAYMCHDNVRLHFRKKKTGDGQYIWQPGLQMGDPDRLNGRPLHINQDMASSIASGNKTLIAGPMRKYKIRQVGAIRMYRLTERHRENDQDAFLAFVEADGKLLDAGTNPVQYLQN